jgi:RNA polymerase sigma-B factor
MSVQASTGRAEDTSALTGLLHVELEVRDATVLVRASGEVDLSSARRFSTVVDEALEAAAERAELVLDLRSLSFIDARGAHALARMAGHAGRGRRLRLLSNPDLDELLRLLGVPLTASVPSASAEYAHLEGVWAEWARLPADHPRRPALRGELVTGYLPVARNIARRFRDRGEPSDDVEQVAALGLVNAVDRFDVERGVDFLAFAVPTMTGEVRRHYRDRAATIRVPRRVRGLQAMVLQAVEELRRRHAAAPRPSAIAEHLGLELGEVIEALEAVHRGPVRSLDEPFAEDDGAGDNPRLGAALATSEPRFELVVDRESVGPLIARLPDRERRILLLRFFGDKTQSEIAAELGISQMHVSRLLATTLAGLRRAVDGPADAPG